MAPYSPVFLLYLISLYFSLDNNIFSSADRCATVYFSSVLGVGAEGREAEPGFVQTRWSFEQRIWAMPKSDSGHC